LAHKVVSPTQTAFMTGWHILEGIVFLHERSMNFKPSFSHYLPTFVCIFILNTHL
jgi:hypothetical protein